MDKIWTWLEGYAESFWTAGEEAFHIIEVIGALGFSIIFLLFTWGIIGSVAMWMLDWIKDKIEEHKNK